MAVSYKEKRELTKIILTKTEEIRSGSLSFKEKREATKAINESAKKLNEMIDAGADSQLLQDLLSGKFNNLAPLPFIEKLREVVASLDGDIGPIKPGVIGFVEHKISAGELVLESAE